MTLSNIFKQKLSEEVWYQTYKWETDENVFDSFRRAAKAVAAVEKDPEYWEEKYFEILSSMRFVTGGRVLSNAGTGLAGTTLINCYVDGFQGENQDSIEGIYEALKRQAKILKSEGGYGFCANSMRPRGAYIKGIGAESPGAVAMLDLWDTSSSVITSGNANKQNKNKGKNKIRKGAQMCCLSIWHPSVEEFITVKQIPGKLTKFNLSVLVHDCFIEAVKKDLPWNLEYPETTFSNYDKEWDGDIYAWKEKGYPIKIYKTYKSARELWDLIMKSTYNRAEPGIIFIDRGNHLNNLREFGEKLNATNPCLAGETLVAVADGRGYVSIKQLAEEGKDVPVYCYTDRGVLTVRYLREPRISGYNQAVYRVTLDDGSVLRVTGNHKFLLNTGTYQEVLKLKAGDSLNLLTKYEANIKEIFPKANSNSSDYWWFKRGDRKGSKSEHRLIAEMKYNSKIPHGYVVHHKDRNSKNNSPDNLEVMTNSEHDQLHGKLMLGLNNPMVRAQTEWSTEKWESYSEKMSKAVSAEKNGRALGITNEDLKKYALELTREKGRRITTKEWQTFALKKGLPSQFSKWRNTYFGGIVGLSKWAAIELGCEYIDSSPKQIETLKDYLSQGIDCEILDGKIVFLKSCEHCGSKFKTARRIQAYCSHICGCTAVSNRSDVKEKVAKAREPNLIIHRQEIRKKQVEIYLDLKFKEKKEPFQKEWKKSCQEKNVPWRLHKGTFPKYKDLKKYAEDYNHRVVSVEFDGNEDVYNGTVDEFHNFFVGGFESVLDNGKKKISNFNNLQCGEQILPVHGSCNLGAINLTQYILEDDFDYAQLEKDLPTILRFQDSINDITNFPLPNQKIEALNKRRVGIGYMGYGSALYLLKEAYGSEAALKKTEKLVSFVTNKLYQASSLLAKEKGSFLLYDREKYLKSNFIKQALTPETVKLIYKNGIRNSHLTTLAPTGNGGVFANLVTGGFEPLISYKYTRTVTQSCFPEGLVSPKNVAWDGSSCEDLGFWRWIKEGNDSLLKIEFEGAVYKYDKNRGLTKEEEVYDYAVLKMGEEFWNDKENFEKEGKEFYGKTIYNLKVDEHLNTMSLFAKYIDSSISKTINLPNDYSYEDFKDVYMKAFDTGYIKGVTTYRMGTMSSVVSVKEENKEEKADRPTKVIVNHAPKRPKSLPCDVHTVQIKGEKWTIFVGLLAGHPFEMFAGKFSEKLSETGVVTKLKSKVYVFESEGKDPINILEKYGEHGTYVYSKLLAHGAPLWSIVDMCDKMNENILGYNKAMGRIIKKYIKKEDVKYMKCSSCGSTDIIFQEGCFLCRCCGTSKCS